MSEEIPEVKSKVDYVDSHVGRKLKMRRIMLGLSQNDLSEAVHVSIQQIQKYEKATNRISSGRLYAFSRLLKVPVSYFYDDLVEEITPDGVSYAAEDSEDFVYDSKNAAERELVSLIRSFNEIKDHNVRKKIIDLVKSLSVTFDESSSAA
jgi:transcriptional regulator with XRE-family HTH domain